MEITIEPMRAEHLDEVHRVDGICFALPWSRQAFEDEINNELAAYFVAFADGVLAGYCGVWDIAGEGDITNIAVLPEYRRRGIAGMLLKAVTDHAKRARLCRLTLEVRESNEPAKRLYAAFGFRRVGMRKNYYSDNNETAEIMALDLSEIGGA